jgi:hypothetical protein
VTLSSAGFGFNARPVASPAASAVPKNGRFAGCSILAEAIPKRSAGRLSCMDDLLVVTLALLGSIVTFLTKPFGHEQLSHVKAGRRGDTEERVSLIPASLPETDSVFPGSEETPVSGWRVCETAPRHEKMRAGSAA